MLESKEYLGFKQLTSNHYVIKIMAVLILQDFTSTQQYSISSLVKNQYSDLIMLL